MSHKRKQALRGLITSIVSATCLLLLSPAARGGLASLEVSPLTVELRMEPGRTYTGSISVANAGTETQHIRVFCQDWTLKPDGVVVFVAAGRLPASASQWVQVTPAEFDLRPGGSQLVRYTLRAPEDAGGEYRTVILFEGAAQKLTLSTGPSAVVPRVGTILYVQVGPPGPPQPRVAAFEVGPDGGSLTVENQGGHHLRFTCRYEIRAGGRLVRAGDLPAFVVLPPPFNVHRMTIPAHLLAGLAPGEYEVTVLLDCGAPALLGARTTVALGPEPPSLLVKRP